MICKQGGPMATPLMKVRKYSVSIKEELRRSTMSRNENEISDDKLSSIEQPCEADRDDPLGPPHQLDSAAIPAGVDRRTFLMRSAVVGATVVITGAQMSCQDRTARATAPPPKVPDAPPLSGDLNVV